MQVFDTASQARQGHRKRFTVWELHPVTSIEGCIHASREECPADDNSVWSAFPKP